MTTDIADAPLKKVNECGTSRVRLLSVFCCPPFHALFHRLPARRYELLRVIHRAFNCTSGVVMPHSDCVRERLYTYCYFFSTDAIGT
ncbi:hypothetical protein D3C85_1685020 [compost metagenome]